MKTKLVHFFLLLMTASVFAGVSGTESGTGSGLSSIPSGFTNDTIQTGTFTATNGATIQGSLTVTNSLITGNVVFGPNNIDAGGGTITNMADGTTASSAVTLSQLQGATNGLSGGGGSDPLALYTNGTRAMGASLNMGNRTITNAAAATVATGVPILSQMNASNALYVTVTGLNSTNSAMNLPRVALTPHRSIFMSDTNGPPRWVPWDLLKDAPNWEANVDSMWETQTVASLVPVITTNYAAPGVSTIPSARTFYATNNTLPPWYLLWGNLATNYSAGSPFMKGALPISSGGGNFHIIVRTAEITNEWQFRGHNSGQSVVAIYVNGHPLGSTGWQMAIPPSTNTNIKLVFPSFRSREITFAVSGYGGSTPGFGYGFVNPAGAIFRPQFRDDGCYYVVGDSGINGYGNGGEAGVTNSAGGFLGGLMFMTGQEWIFDGSGGRGYLSGGVGSRFTDTATNSIPLLIANGKKIKAIWAMGGGSDASSNATLIVTAVTNFFTAVSNQNPTIPRWCGIPWDAFTGGSYPNAVTNIQNGCNLLGVPTVNINRNITSAMLTNPQYVWTTGPFVGHPTSDGHKLIEDQFLRDFMTISNGWRSGR